VSGESDIVCQQEGVPLRVVGQQLAGISLLALCAAGVPVAAAAKPITGELSEPGYTVIALAPNGKADTDRAPRGKFHLRPPADGVTVHLRAPDGVYAGPVVVTARQGGKLAVLGLESGAELGRIAVRDGYAEVARKLPGRWVDREREARARKGVPIGAGVFGRVRSKPPRSAPRGDGDVDGISDPVDVDDDGDLVLDNLERSRKERTLRRYVHASGEFLVHSQLNVGLAQTANANAPGLSDAQIEAALPAYGSLAIEILPGDSAELDCGVPQSRTDPGVGGLVYCSTGGTGTVRGAPFPDDFDPDGDGLGRLDPEPNLPAGAKATFLSHGATSAQIGTGDVLIERVTRGGSETPATATLVYVFATTPALVSYDDGVGNARTVSYPVRGHTCPPDCSQGPDPGVMGNGFPVSAGPDGDVKVTLTFWRPQRRPIAGEPGYSEPPREWTDIGGLNYRASIAGQDPGSSTCEQNAYSTADPNLVPTDPTLQPGGGGFRDTTSDRPANAANTFAYTLNLSKCLSSKGISFGPGEERTIEFAAVTPNADDAASTTVSFKRQ
jgi:hypothetical protein